MFLWYSWFFVAVIPDCTVELSARCNNSLSQPFVQQVIDNLRLIPLGQQPPSLEWTLWVRKITWKASRKSWWNCSLWLNWTLLTTGAGKLSVQRMWIWARITHFRWYKHTGWTFWTFCPRRSPAGLSSAALRCMVQALQPQQARGASRSFEPIGKLAEAS